MMTEGFYFLYLEVFSRRLMLTCAPVQEITHLFSDLIFQRVPTVSHSNLIGQKLLINFLIKQALTIILSVKLIRYIHIE